VVFDPASGSGVLQQDAGFEALQKAGRRSIEQLERQLKHARAIAQAGNGAEGGGVGVVHAAGLTKLHGVEGVEGLRAELQPKRFRQGEVLAGLVAGRSAMESHPASRRESSLCPISIAIEVPPVCRR
jgi:hypothetical protein